MTEQTTTTPPADDAAEPIDDTVQGVAKRAEVEIAEAQRLQDEQNAAAGLNPPDAPVADPAPVQPPADPKPTTRKPAGA